MAKVRAYTTGDTGVSATTTVVLPTYAQNDLLVIWIGIKSLTNTFDTPAGWTLYVMADRHEGSGGADLYYKIAGASESNVVISQTGGTTSSTSWQCISIQGVDTSNPIDAAADGETAGSSVTQPAPQPTTVTANTLVMYFCSCSGGLGSLDPTLNFGHVVWKGLAEIALGTVSAGVYWEFRQAIGLVPQRTFTLSSAYQPVLATLAFKDASPTGTPTRPSYVSELVTTPISLSSSFYAFNAGGVMLNPPDRASYADQSMDLSATGGFGTFDGFTAASDITFATSKIITSVSARFANCRIGDNITITGTTSNNKTGYLTAVTSSTSITWDQTTVNESPASTTMVTNSRRRMVISPGVPSAFYGRFIAMIAGSGTLPTGMTEYVPYGVTWISTTVFALQVGNTPVNLTAAGTGTVTMRDIGSKDSTSYSGTTSQIRMNEGSAVNNLYGKGVQFSAAQNLSGKVVGFLSKCSTYAEPPDKIWTMVVTFLGGSNNFSSYRTSVYGSIMNWVNSIYNLYVIDPANTADRLYYQGALDPTNVLGMAFFVENMNVAPTTNWQYPAILAAMKIAGGTASVPVMFEDFSNYVKKETAGGPMGGAYGGVFFSFPCFTVQGNAQYYACMPINVGDGTNGLNANLDGTSLEFLQRLNTTRKSYQGNLSPNVLGIEYYLPSGSVVSHQNSVISCSHQFYFRVNASSSASATYNFSGLTVVGAGIVTLQPVTTYTGMIFSGCAKIAASGCALTNCTVNNPLAAQTAALQISTTSTLIGCKFTTTTAADYAIQLDAAGTYTLNACTFTGFTNALNVTATTGTVTVNITNGGTVPTYVTAGATVIVQTLNTFTVTCKDVAGANIENARISVRKVSDNTELIGGLTNSSGVLTDTFTYAGAILIRARKSTGGATRYLPVDSPQVLTASAFSLIITLTDDSIASA